MKDMKTITTKIYKCIYCGKIYQKRNYAKKHHLKCKKNPKNIGCCNNCNNLQKKEFTVNFSNYYNEWKDIRESLYCSKKKIYLKPRWSSQIEDYSCDDMPTIENMPIECDSLNLK